MTDRYNRYPPRPRSPTFNPARASLPIISGGYSSYEQPHHHVAPISRREVIPPRSSSNTSNAGTIMTTYKVTTDPMPSRGSSVREGSRNRRSTLDNHNPPTIVTTTPRHRPVIHSSGGVRPTSPLKNPYRSSEEDYVAIPASSRHGHHHRKQHGATVDNGDMRGGGLRVIPVREPNYANTRSRPIYPGQLVRRADTVSEDYGDNGYGYTNPSDLVRYDLSRAAPLPPVQTRPRGESFDGRTSRPSSITSYNDLVASRAYDNRERGPPPSTRGFDRIPTRGTWEQPQIRLPVPPPPSALTPVEPIQRPAPFEPIEPPRRSSSRVRPTSLYHDREPRRGPREDYYEVRDDERDRRERLHHHERYDDSVEPRGFGLRAERPERSERSERPERPERPERSERTDRTERSERVERTDRAEKRWSDEERSDSKDHKSRDALATGLSLAGAALGIKAVKNTSRDSRDDRDDRDDRRREYEEPRRRSDRDDRDSVELSGRDPKERRHRDDDLPPPPRDGPAPRDIPPPPGPPPHDRDVKAGSPSQAPALNLSGRDPRERKSSKDERDNDPERRERRRRRSEVPDAGSADSRSDSSVSPDDTSHPARKESRVKRTSGVAVGAFNPKDTMDLKALKEALNSKDTAPKAAPKEPVRTPRESLTKDPREVVEIRKELNDRQPRNPLAPTENRQLRVVSPPREKVEEKPVKGILRTPREKFPEDPAPIREGVAPLKDAKKDGIPPDARWTKISRKLVNPEALEAGKERFEAREDFVIVLRVLSRDEVQGYAEVTQRIRAAREELEEIEAQDRRRARRERHERHKRERNGEVERSERSDRRRHRRDRERERERDRESNSESDSTDEQDYEEERPKMLEAPKKKQTFDEPVMSGGLGEAPAPKPGPLGLTNMSNLRENPDVPGQYVGYVRNPPPPQPVGVKGRAGSGGYDQ